MHATAVVQEQRLGHEGGGLVVAPGGVLHHVLVLEHVVGHGHQWREAHVDLTLAGGSHFMVLRLDQHADALQRHHHLAAQILLAVGRRHREVAFLVARLVAEVGILLATRVPAPLFGVDVVVALVLVLVEADVVEDEEFRFRTDIDRVGEAGRAQIRFRLARDVARVTRVVLAGNGIADVADHDQRLAGQERIDETGLGNRLDQHVRLVDRLPTADAGAVKPQSSFEVILREFARRDRKVLPQTGEVHETDVDHLHAFIRDQLHYIAGRLECHKCSSS